MLLVMYRRQAEINKFVVYSFVCPPQVNLFCSGLAQNLTQFFDGLLDRCAVTLYFDSQSEEPSVPSSSLSDGGEKAKVKGTRIPPVFVRAFRLSRSLEQATR